MVLCLWAPNLVRERLRWRVSRNLRQRQVESIYIIFPCSLAKLEFWRDIQPKPGAGDLAIEPSKLEFWLLISTKAWSG